VINIDDNFAGDVERIAVLCGTATQLDEHDGNQWNSGYKRDDFNNSVDSSGVHIQQV
jgi:hypothetical protein